MYKRTVERIVGIIGLVIAGFQTGAGILSLVAAHSSVLKTKMLSADSADHVHVQLAEMNRVGTSFLIFSGLAFVLALCAICLLSAKRRGTKSGILLISAGVIILGNLLVVGPNPGMFSAALFMISGIITIQKKPKLY